MNKLGIAYWIGQLKVGDPPGQVEALRTLAGLLNDYPEAVKAVIGILINKEQTSGVRQTAICSLGKLTSPSAEVLQVLREASADPDNHVSLVAADVLSRFQPKEE